MEGGLDALHGLRGRAAALGGVVERDLRDLPAQALDELAEGLVRGRVAIPPGVRLHEREQRRQRPVLGGGGEQARAARRQARGIALVVGLQRVGEEGHVLHRPAHDADRVERVRVRQHAGAGDHPERRLEPIDAAEGGRADDGAPGLRAERRRHHAAGDSRGRARGGAAGRVLDVVRDCACPRDCGLRAPSSRSCRG